MNLRTVSTTKNSTRQPRSWSREQLEALVDAEMDEKEAARRWKRVKELAPGLWEQSGARRIIETLVTEYITTHRCPPRRPETAGLGVITIWITVSALE